MLVCMGAQAQTATLMEGFGEPLTLTQFKAMANQSQRFGFVASSNTAAATAPRCDHWCGFTSTHATTTLSDDYLFYLETSGDNYLVKRCSDDQYVISDASTTTFGAAGTAFKLVERNPNDATAAVWGDQSISFEDLGNPNMHYNANAVVLNGGPGAWTTYAVFGPIYKDITIDCQENGVSMEGYPQEFTYKAGTVEAPVFPGKKLVDGEPTSVTVSEDNQTITFNYESSSFDYTLVVNGAPEGTTIKIKDETVSAGDVSFESEVTQSDVVVTFPTGFESYVATVTINGTTITVNCAYKQTVITEVSEITSNKVYTVESQGRGAWTMASDGSALRSTKASGASTTAKQWAFVTYETNTYLYNVETKKFILKNSANASAEATHGTPVTIVKYTSDQMDGWGASFDDFQASGHYFAAQMGTDGDYTAYINFGGSMQTTVDGWGPGNAPGYNAKCGADAGNALRITEVGEFDPTEALTALDNYFNPQYTINYIVKDEAGATLFSVNDIPTTEGATITTLPEEYQRSLFYTYNTVDVTITESVTTIEFTATWKDDAPFVQSTSYDDATWYYATIRGSKYVRADEDAKDGNGRYQTNNTNEETDVYKWAFIGNPYSNFWIANMGHGDGKYLYAADDNAPAMTAVEDPANTDAAKWEVIINGNGFNLRSLTGDNLYINDNGNTGCIGYWNSTWGRTDTGGKLTLTKILNDEEKYNELIALLESYELGDNLHEYGFEGYTASEATTTISNLKAAGYTPENMTTAQNLAAAAKLNLPKAGMFFRVKSNAHGTYLSGVASTDPANRMTLTTDADANTIFYFDGNKMLTYGKGLYAKGRDVAAAGGEGVDYWFEESTITPTRYAIRFNPDGGSNRFLYAWDDSKGYADQNGADHVNCVFTLEEVKELPVTLHESETKEGYSVWIATFSAPVSVVSVEGAEIHKVTDTGAAFFCEPANVQGIPAGKGALLVTDTETETATVTLGETSDDFETILQSLYACEKGKAGLFFGKVEGSQIAGLYPIDSETPTGGFKAFVDDSTGEGKELIFTNDPNSINTIENGADNGAIYNLQGQRVNKAQKGVFIQNGKKVVLK